jgi:hypothetical protein
MEKNCGARKNFVLASFRCKNSLIYIRKEIALDQNHFKFIRGNKHMILEIQ